MAAARERSERVGLSINSLKSRYAFTQLQKKSQEREWLLERCCSLSREGMVAGRLPPFLTSDKRDDLLVRATLRMMPMPLMSAVASHTFEATSALELYIDHQAATAHGRHYVSVSGGVTRTVISLIGPTVVRRDKHRRGNR